MSSKSQVVLNPGTVSAIKTQFEKLCNAAEAPQTKNTCKCNNNNRRSFGLPSNNINIKTTNNKNNNNNNNNIQIRNKPPVPIKSFHMQRSITSLELQRPSQEQIDNFRLKQQALFRKSFQRQVTSLPMQTPSIEIAIETSVQTEDELKPLPPLSLTGGKATALLSRCTVDPVKRNSIKRSPAFRVGDKQNNAILVKQHPATTSTSAASVNPEQRKSGITKPAYRSILHSSNDTTTGVSTRQLNNFLAQRCAGHLEQMQQPGMTDSIRAALLRPLPSGPPPKKPPRISEMNKRNCA